MIVLAVCVTVLSLVATIIYINEYPCVKGYYMSTRRFRSALHKYGLTRSPPELVRPPEICQALFRLCWYTSPTCPHGNCGVVHKSPDTLSTG